MQRRSSARLAEAVGLQQHQLDPGSMVGAAGGPQLQPAPLPGVGASLLNMPLQEQLRMMQQGGALPAAPPLVLSGAPPAGPPAGAPAPSPAPTGRKKAQRGTVARASEREATKGTTSSSNRPLSSRFRGVCWNRKNKRWQAAINSGGALSLLARTACARRAACGERRPGHTRAPPSNPPSPPLTRQRTTAPTTGRQVPVPRVVR